MSGYDCRNKWLFSFWRNVVSDGANWTSTGRLFQSRGPAAANERSPTVTSRDGRTSSRLEVDERSRPRRLDVFISALPEYNQSLLDFCYLVDSRLIFTLLWLPKSCNECLHLGAVGGMVQDKRSWEHCRSWTLLHASVRCLMGISQGAEGEAM